MDRFTQISNDRTVSALQDLRYRFPEALWPGTGYRSLPFTRGGKPARNPPRLLNEADMEEWIASSAGKAGNPSTYNNH